MNFRGFFTKAGIEALTDIQDDDCFCLTEDATIGGLEINKGNVAMYSDGKWSNLAEGGHADCCKLTKDISAHCPVGYVEEGDLLGKGTTFTDVFDSMFRRKNA